MAINFSGTSFISAVSEIAGYKSGVALSWDDLSHFFRQHGYERYADIEADDWIRIRSEEFEEIIEELLFSLGRIEQRGNKFPSIALWHKYKKKKDGDKLYKEVMALWTEWMQGDGKEQMESGVKLLDPSSLMLKVLKKHGRRGLAFLTEFFERLNASITVSPWSDVRQFEWHNEIEPKQLFESEGLNSLYGKFFDQRYVDFLNRNFDNVDRMNWRKFEQLTAEYFDRQGFKVDLGPGRGDDGVDVRAWLPNADNPSPHIIVQCKRQRNPIEKVVIKALYADVVHERATSGLVVTTSRLSRGALETKTARAYPVDVADRDTLKDWLKRMREPGVGIVA